MENIGKILKKTLNKLENRKNMSGEIGETYLEKVATHDRALPGRALAVNGRLMH